MYTFVKSTDENNKNIRVCGEDKKKENSIFIAHMKVSMYLNAQCTT